MDLHVTDQIRQALEAGDGTPLQLVDGWDDPAMEVYDRYDEQRHEGQS